MLKKDEGISSYVNISVFQRNLKTFSGNGKTSIESCNNAANSALKYLSELPLNQAQPIHQQQYAQSEDAEKQATVTSSNENAESV